MKHILIADAGSTKTDWALLSPEGKEALRFSTPGLNAILATEEQAGEMFASVRSQLGDAEIKDIHYYGAGCATEQICSGLSRMLREHMGSETASVHSDLLGAARGLLGREKGIACILGTGSNSCLYDGERIVSNIPSLGFILGDEGSGAALGKRFLSDLFKQRLPESVRDRFRQQYPLTLAEILEKVYRQPAPNRFLASLVPFIKETIWNPYVYSMVQREFARFYRRNVSAYKGARFLPVNFTGGVANAFPDILREAAARKGIRVGIITPSPMQGLIRFHTPGES